MSFAEDLKTMRTIRKLTQAQLADKALTSQAFVSHIETGKMLPTPELKERLKRALGWTAVQNEAFRLLECEPVCEPK